MNVGRFDHVAITVRDVEVTSRFYQQALGAQVGHDHMRGGRVAIRKIIIGEAVFNLHQADNDVELIAKHPTSGAADVCMRWTGSIESAVETLNRAGVPIVDGPSIRTNSSGRPAHSVYFHDPDGNLMELMAEDPG
jgi:catechol 2,3-dioxygenase-like lactoylglutathione lyase family enzyme